MKITPQRAAQLAAQAGLAAVPMERSGRLHIRYHVGEGAVRMGIVLPLDESIEGISERLNMLRALGAQPQLKNKADKFVELLQAEEEQA